MKASTLEAAAFLVLPMFSLRESEGAPCITPAYLFHSSSPGSKPPKVGTVFFTIVTLVPRRMPTTYSVLMQYWLTELIC